MSTAKDTNNCRIPDWVGYQTSEIPTAPFKKIFIDHISLLPLSKSRNQYLLTIVNAFSKFTFLILTRNTKAQTTINSLTKYVFAYYGFPKFSVTDNDPSFKFTLLAQMHLDYRIKHVCTSPYYPNPSHAQRVNKNYKSRYVYFIPITRLTATNLSIVFIQPLMPA